MIRNTALLVLYYAIALSAGVGIGLGLSSLMKPFLSVAGGN